MKFLGLLGLFTAHIFLSGCATTELVATQDETADCVVLLHGLARSSRSMLKMQRALSAANYAVLNVDYPSRRYAIEDLSEQYLRPALMSDCVTGRRKVHFVTHSLGGIILRYYLQQHDIPKLGRVVMLSPPNKGSEVVDVLRDNIFFKWINGPAGRQLGTGADSILRQLSPPDFELGVITGNRSINLVLSTLIPGADDGKVGVHSARVKGMRDFLVVPYSHPFIMRRKAVIAEVIHFLRAGCFGRL